MSRASIALLIFTLGATGCSQAPLAPLPTVERVDLARYQGTWYEVAMLPNSFQSMCVQDTQARYTQDGEHIRVQNRCRKTDGSIAEANGIAKITADTGNAKLRVSFFRPFYGDYWILALDPEYRWVLVGEPRRRYGWVLSRTPTLSEADLISALDRAVTVGYDRGAFKRTPQSGPPIN